MQTSLEMGLKRRNQVKTRSFARTLMQGDWVFGKRDTRHREDVETQGEDQEKAGLEWGICRPREAGGPPGAAERLGTDPPGHRPRERSPVCTLSLNLASRTRDSKFLLFCALSLGSSLGQPQETTHAPRPLPGAPVGVLCPHAPGPGRCPLPSPQGADVEAASARHRPPCVPA